MGVRADAVTQLDGPSGPTGEEPGPHAHVDPVAQREQGPLEVGRVHPGVEGRRGEHGAVLELTDAPVHRLVADEDAEQRGGADALGRSGAAPRGHFHQGVGPALPRGAGQLVDPAGAPQALFGLGTVGLEEVVFQAVELARHDGARNGVQRHLAQPHATQARLQEHIARGLALLVGGLGPVGVGQLLPIVEHPGEVLEAHLLGLGHEHLFVAGHGGLGAVAPRRGDGLGLVGPDGPVSPRLGHRGQVTQGASQADLALGPAAGEPTTRGEPRCRRLGPVSRPLLAHLEGRRGLGDEGVQTRLDSVQPLHRLAVAVVRGVGNDECVERLLEDVQLHVSMEARSCDNGRRQNLIKIAEIS